MIERVQDAPDAYDLANDTRAAVAALFAAEAVRFPPSVAEMMRWLAGRFAPTPNDRTDA